jgi:hypothetical protein
MVIPGPLRPAEIGAITKSSKAKCELFVYTAVVFIMLFPPFVFFVVLFLWIWGVDLGIASLE